MNFEYFIEQRANDSIEIDDIGNCVIVADNDLGKEYYLIIKTIMGTTETVEYGPVDLSDNKQSVFSLPDSVYYSYSRDDYSQQRINKRIDAFLNNPKRAITQAREGTIDEISNNIKNFIDCLQKDK